MKEFKDFLGNTVNVGDEIVFMCVGYRSLRKGVIVSITNKKALIRYADKAETRQFHEQMVLSKKLGLNT